MLEFLLGFIKNRNEKYPIIDIKTLEDFIEALKKENCMWVKVHIVKRGTGCSEVKDNDLGTENVSYFTKLSSKSNNGKILAFSVEYGKMTEPFSDTFEIKNFTKVFEDALMIIEKIKKEIPSIDPWLIIPKQRCFRSDDYKKLNLLLNSLPSFQKVFFINLKKYKIKRGITPYAYAPNHPHIILTTTAKIPLFQQKLFSLFFSTHNP